MTPAGQAAEQTFESISRSVPAARRFLTGTLDEWDQDGLLWDAQQIVAELAANAVLHAGGASFSVRLTLMAGGGLRIDVVDPSPRPPRLRHFGPDAATGRGLALVADLSRSWGVERRPPGKSVWCEVAGQPSDGESRDEDVRSVPTQIGEGGRSGEAARITARAAIARAA